nr:SET domain-containing protein [Tanacetum cinerariifolium]
EQQNSAQSSPQVEDEHVLVMELSEKDILFAKKKKLLEVKGFDPTGKVKIQGNSSIESVKSVLEEMLQRARILNSDEEQQNSAQSSPQVEDEHVLVMELSEKDILFAKKKYPVFKKARLLAPEA